MTAEKHGFLRMLSLAGIGLGVVTFGVGAAMLSEVALAGIALAAFGSVGYTWISLGPKAVVGGLGSGLVGAFAAWVAMRLMMRWVALGSGILPVLTLEGTSAILGTSLIMSVLPAMGYLHFRQRFGPSFGKSFLYGLVLSGAGGIPILMALSGEISAVAREPLVPASFLLGVPILYALALESAHRVFRDRWSAVSLPEPQ